MKVSDDPRKEKRLGNFPGSPVAKTLPSNVVGAALIPGQGISCHILCSKGK